MDQVHSNNSKIQPALKTIFLYTMYFIFPSCNNFLLLLLLMYFHTPSDVYLHSSYYEKSLTQKLTGILAIISFLLVEPPFFLLPPAPFFPPFFDFPLPFLRFSKA